MEPGRDPRARGMGGGGAWTPGVGAVRKVADVGSSAGTEIEGAVMGTWSQGTEGMTERRAVPTRLRKR